MAAVAALPVPAATQWRAIGLCVRLVVTNPARLAAGRRQLARRIDELDRACSRFRADSELAQAERRAGTPVPVSRLLAGAVAVALDAASQTGGDLDPTVGAALAALGYDRDFTLVPPDGPPVTVRVDAQPRWADVQLDLPSQRLTVPRGVRLDLGATVKAWAADRAAAELSARLGCGVLVSLGGDIAVAGPAPAGGWRIRVQDMTGDPDDEPTGPTQIVTLTRGGLSTSGVAARRWRRGGVLLHHILDPRTGLPAVPVWRTVSALAPSALAANIATTTAIIRGDRAPAWLARRQVAARLVAADGTIRTTGYWPDPAQAAA